MRRMLLVSAVLCAATSCTQVTQTTVIITADETVTAANPRVTVTVNRRDGSPLPQVLGEDRNEIPPEGLRVAIVPIGGDGARTYEVIATATDSTRTWTTRAISGFVSGQRRELRMRLEERCRTMTCSDATTTCRDGSCVNVEVPAGMLTVPGESDAGMRVDAAVQPGADARPVERCPWQVETVLTGDEVPSAPLVSVDGGSVFIAYTKDVRLFRGVQMVRRLGSGWSAPEVLVPATEAPREVLFSFRVDMGTWRIATVDDEGSTKRLRTQGGGAPQPLPPGVNPGFFPQMGLSAEGPRFLTFISASMGSAIWTASDTRPIPGMSGADGYAPNGPNDSVVSDGMLYRYRGGSWMGPVAVHPSRDSTSALLSEPDGTLHVIYSDGTNAMHLSVPPGGALGVATRIAPGGSDQAYSAAGPSMFYWAGRLWNRDGSMRDEVPIPSGWQSAARGGLVIDDAGGLHLVAQITPGASGTGVRYAYRPPCP